MRFPFSRSSFGAADVRAVVRALRAGQVGGNGEIGARVERRLAELTGCTHALLTPNATQAMEMALVALGIGPGDEVLMPSFAFVSQANAILARGARPVFCEIEPDSMNLDPEDAERRVTPRTRLLMPVHYAGIPCDLDALLVLARSRRFLLFEDAAQALGSTWNGRHVGALGDAGCLSFHFTKNLTCGEGGVLLTNRDDLARICEIVREKGTNRSAFLRGEVDKYTWVSAGGSYVLADLLAALLEAQLERLGEIQSSRQRVWQTYHEGLAELEARGVLRRPVVPSGAGHNAHIYWFRTESPERQRTLLARLKARGIPATFHFQPLHASPYAREVLRLDQHLPITEREADCLVRLPLHAHIREREALQVVEEVVRASIGT